jgi:hypothetical protein
VPEAEQRGGDHRSLPPSHSHTADPSRTPRKANSSGTAINTHNATVNPTGFAVAVLGLPQGEVLYIVGALVILAATTVIIATHGRLGADGTPQAAETCAVVTAERA